MNNPYIGKTAVGVGSGYFNFQSHKATPRIPGYNNSTDKVLINDTYQPIFKYN